MPAKQASKKYNGVNKNGIENQGSGDRPSPKTATELLLDQIIASSELLNEEKDTKLFKTPLKASRVPTKNSTWKCRPVPKKQASLNYKGVNGNRMVNHGSDDAVPNTDDSKMAGIAKPCQSYPSVQFPPLICQPGALMVGPSAQAGAQPNRTSISLQSVMQAMKKRPNGIKIIDPSTNEEVTVTERITHSQTKGPVPPSALYQNNPLQVIRPVGHTTLQAKTRPNMMKVIDPNTNKEVTSDVLAGWFMPPPVKDSTAHPVQIPSPVGQTISSAKDEGKKKPDTNRIKDYNTNGEQEERRTNGIQNSHLLYDLAPIEELQAELTDLMKKKKPYGTVLQFIMSKIKDKFEDWQLVHVLIRSMCDACTTDDIHGYSFDQYSFKRYEKLVKRFVNNQEELELECLNAIHISIEETEHPTELVNHIFNFFHTNALISNESFLEWRDDEEGEVRNKLFSLSKLNSFYSAIDSDHSPVNIKPQNMLMNAVEEPQPIIEPVAPLPTASSVNEPIDCCTAFGQMCAAELRQLKIPENRVKFKRMVMDAIYNIAEADATGKIYYPEKR